LLFGCLIFLAIAAAQEKANPWDEFLDAEKADPESCLGCVIGNGFAVFVRSTRRNCPCRSMAVSP